MHHGHPPAPAPSIPIMGKVQPDRTLRAALRRWFRTSLSSFPLRRPAATPPLPLRPDELVTDETLRRYYRGEPCWQRGEISPAMQAELTMVLPDIFGELLAYRLAARPDHDFPAPRNHAEEITNALREAGL